MSRHSRSGNRNSRIGRPYYGSAQADFNYILDSLTHEPNGLVAHFNQPNPYMVIRDASTLANNFNGNVNSKLTYASPSLKIVRDESGRWDHAPHNYIRNNSMQGAVAGTPGTIPTNWVLAGGVGLTRTIATGTENGIEYIEFRFNGTTGDANGIQIDYESHTQIVAATGQTWTLAPFFSLAAGSFANVTSVTQTFRESTAAGAFVAFTGGSDFKASFTAALQRFAHTGTLAGGGTVARVTPRFSVAYSAGVAVDFTIRIGWPQIEQRRTASAPIRTTSAAQFNLPIDYTAAGVPLGLLVEGARTNEIRNNSMQGAVAGSPGTLPTNWLTTSTGTLTRTVVGTGTENGVEYIDIRLNGTTSTTFAVVEKEISTTIVAATGQTWTQTAFVSIVGGSVTNISDIGIQINELTNVGGFVRSNYQSIRSSLTSTLQRFTHTATFSGGGTVARAHPIVLFSFSSGVTIDITLRIGWPQMEQAAFASSPIRTTSAAVTRAADDVSLLTSALPSFSSGGYMVARFVPGTVTLNGTTAVALVQNGSNVTLIQHNTTGKRAKNTIAGVDAPNLVPTGTVVVGTPTTVAYSFAASNYKAASDGGTIQTSVSGATLPTYATLQIGALLASSNHLFGWIQWAKAVPRTTLTDAQVVSESALT